MSLSPMKFGGSKWFMWKVTMLMVIFTAILCEELTLYSKVNSKYPADFIDCTIETHNTPKHVLCGNLCSHHVDCHLYCLTQDGKCMLSKAKVSLHWKGVDDPLAPSWNCFSSWGKSNDAMANASISASPTFIPGQAEKEMAVNGYICTSEDGYMYKSKSTNQPWWAADLGVVRRVTSVRVFTRPGSIYTSRFVNIEVRVGISNPGNGDFTDNALLGFYSGEAPKRSAVTFKATRPIAGSVVSIQSIEGSDYLFFADVQVLYTY
ncbi:uncharacterized protein [Palaemon carinicauda]|uniref:uncharacterized protein n=1 Tax=Palaemon carinicauda TaxID=392227 RepID=UPI0035B69097